MVLIGISASYFSIITDYHKYHITNEQIVDQTTWQLMDKFLASRVFKEVASGSTIYAPSLYRAIIRHSLLHPMDKTITGQNMQKSKQVKMFRSLHLFRTAEQLHAESYFSAD